MTDVSPKISTNVRFTNTVLTTALGLLSELAPTLAERSAVALFRSPRRPRALRPPSVDGFVSRARTLGEGTRALASWSWGEGPTVLLVHGWNGHAGQMARFVAPLVSRGHRVVAFDLPAHGRSSGRSVDVLDLAEAVDEVARREDARAIVAHSLGATATALALSRGLEIERVALLAPPAEVPHFARALASAIGLSRARTEGMLARIRDDLGDLDALDLRRLASSMRAHALVVHDPEDREVPFEHGRAIAEAWPDARLLAPSGLGHRGGLRDPEVVARVVSFVTREQER